MRFASGRKVIGRRVALVAALAGASLLPGPPGGVLSAAAQGSAVRETVRIAGREVALTVTRERGFPAVAWSEVPEEVVGERSGSPGRGTGRAPWGEPVEVRTGSPFARVGAWAVPLVNAPYETAGELRVPLTLLERIPPLRPPAGAAGAFPAAPPPDAARGSPESAAPRADRPFRVMLDPGHGGHDPGTVNRRTGAREKDIVLAVGRHLRDELRRRPGIEVEMTRDDDRFIPLRDRPRKALAAGADLFLSIHVNAEPGGRGRARGFETYFLAPARSDESADVARRENAVLELEGDEAIGAGEQGIDKIVTMLVRDANRDGSQDFGRLVQTRMAGIMGGPDRGTKPGPFWVLVGATGHMPAVLVELGFITHGQEVKQLTDAKTQRRLAAAIADAIEAHVARVGPRQAAARGMR
ncbi:MAG: N-acetylmuramoyl-L-alanine amidase [Gemmatimonadota bacterium]|nr:N-acetylmuramoyl-L-alanine amidase [Gemmatimonadota bacterium]